MSPSSAGDPCRYAQCSDALLLPFIHSPGMVHMGLHKLHACEWIQSCCNLPHYLHNKLRVRRELGERVYAQLPESLPAQRELHQLLFQHLRRDQAPHYFASADLLHWRTGANSLCWPVGAGEEPLWNASQWVADDLCLLQPGEGGYRLTAASLSAPSYWRLEDKIGRPLQEIHAPVPGFAPKIGSQVARFFEHLLPEYPVWRSNWSVVSSPELLQRGSSAAGDQLYLRVERQSLRRLPRTGAVVFTIRVMINPLEDLRRVPGAVAALGAAARRLSPQEARYKSLAPLLPALERFFQSEAMSG